MIWHLDGQEPDTDWPWPVMMFIVTVQTQFNLMSISFMRISWFNSVA
jgi:hypothetical protein